MTNTQKARYNAYSLALAHLKENGQITSGIPVFEALYLSAKTTLDAISDTNRRRIQKLKGVTDSKQQLQDSLSTQALAIASVISTYASVKKDLMLKESMNFSKSELFYGGGQLLNEKSANILTKAKELATSLKDYGITDALLDSFESLLQDYAANVNEPRSMTAERKQAGIQVKELFKQLNRLFIEQLDRMMLLFKFTHSDFYEQYMIKREIVDPTRRKTSVKGTVTDKTSGKALAGVTVILKNTELSTTTADDGSYSLKTPIIEEMPVIYQKDGYKPATKEATVKRGQSTIIDVAMEFV
jgi:hypothetical protein